MKSDLLPLIRAFADNRIVVEIMYQNYSELWTQHDNTADISKWVRWFQLIRTIIFSNNNADYSSW